MRLVLASTRLPRCLTSQRLQAGEFKHYKDQWPSTTLSREPVAVLGPHCVSDHGGLYKGASYY